MRNRERHPQRVINNLVNAVGKGAIGGTFRDGMYIIYPNTVVDKDGFEEQTDYYAQVLPATGVSRADARRSAQSLKDRFYSGTIEEQYNVAASLSSAVKALTNRTNR